MAFIGAPLDRKEGRAKVTGAAKYAAEFDVEGLAHAVLVQSTIASGSIISIDTAAAARMPGVLLIVTPDNAMRLQLKKVAPQAVTAPFLQDRSIVYQGQHVAVVVAETLEQAQDAAGHVTVKYIETPARTVMDRHVSAAVVPKNFRGGQRSPDSLRGNPDAAFAAAPVQVAQTYTTPVEHHNPMEAHATIATWHNGGLTVWHTTQGISGAKKMLAGLFGLEPDRVRVICPHLGGGFGSKGNAWPPLSLAAMAAKMLGRPVKLELTRQQMFTSNGYRPRTIQTVKLGADRDGKLVALRHDGFSQTSTAELGEFCEPFALASELMYSVPNAAVSHRLVEVNQGLPTYMRAPGEAPGIYALESAMDELAVAANVDPIELRLRNYADIDEHTKLPFSSKKLRECYATGAEMFGWSKRTAAPRSMRDGRFLVGYGMASSTYPMNRSLAHARVRLGADGTVLVQAGSQDIGTGTYTVMSQVAADGLGVDVSRVRVELGDSSLPPSPVSGGSMTVASLGPAVQKATAMVRDRVFRLAAAHWATDPAALTLRDGIVSGPSGKMSVAELMAREQVPHVEETAETKPGDETKHYSMHSFGAQFCEVRVDPDLGEVRVSRWVGAFDCGRVLNAKTARSQLIGGITFGIGMALLEATHVDAATGRYTNQNVSEYLMAVNADIPDIRTHLVANEDLISNSLGARGLGELPMVGAAAAVANAVFHATGKRVRDLPIRIEDVLTA